MKLTYMENYADTMGLLSKVKHWHWDKAPTNLLLARAVERCVENGMTYLCYGDWSRGGLGAFKRHNGFERFELPRYYIPLTMKGRIILKFRLHRNVVSLVPERVVQALIEMRTWWYSKLTG